MKMGKGARETYAAMKTKWIFGYHGSKETYWVEAANLIGFYRQVAKRGMERPDWYEDTNHSA